MGRKTFMTILFAGMTVSWSAWAQSDLNVIVEAENFVKQSGGSVEKLSDRIDASGGRCFKNWDNAGHALEWTVEIPETGEYKVVLRYAADRKNNAYRELLIDDTAPAEAFNKIAWSGTGGWSSDVNNWKNLVVSDDQGNPVLITLEKGTHTVRITNLGGDKKDGSGNLDSIGFLTKDADPDLLGKEGKTVRK